jgi:hypothetical protein
MRWNGMPFVGICSIFSAAYFTPNKTRSVLTA